uniref:non-specific protein-tyrosine kinase n=1 Tax=Sinocyclocheilus rhinocerous TaxID=307959 RepID=A0A673HP96_9TELE
MQCEEGTEWLLELLMEVQLQQYFLRIRDELNVTRLSHFDYVKNEDLEKIGMGRPGQRRLWEAVKRRKTMCKRKSWMSKVCHQPSSNTVTGFQSRVRSHTHLHASSWTRASLYSLVSQLTCSLKHFRVSNLQSVLLNLKGINQEVTFKALDLDDFHSLSSFGQHARTGIGNH